MTPEQIHRLLDAAIRLSEGQGHLRSAQIEGLDDERVPDWIERIDAVLDEIQAAMPDRMP